MNIEYHKWWSSALNQDMELKVYGHGGQAVLVFPAFCGRFYEFEDFGMVNTLQYLIEAGRITLFTVDSVDAQSWGNAYAHPAQRVNRHEDYTQYITQEVLPFIRNKLGETAKPITTGCSMGGFHAASFYFRHPDVFSGMISLSGLFQMRMFIGDYCDDLVYYNCPLYFLPNLSDAKTLAQYQKGKIIICTGQGPWEDIHLEDARQMDDILKAKNIPAWVDYWGYDVNHDWPWWHRQLPYFLEIVLET